jgi:flavodoxin
MQTVIVYWSRYGNGKKIVEHLDKTLKSKGVQSTLFRTDETDPATIPQADVYVFSAPAEALNIPKDMRAFMKHLQGTSGKPYGVINTHAMKKDRLYKMEKILKKKAMVKRAGLEFTVGEDVQSGLGLPQGWEATVDAFADKLNE